MTTESSPHIPNTSTTWQLWHSDRFDADTLPIRQCSGENILEGLYQLWRYTLYEGIMDDGNASFSFFHLTWGTSAATRADVVVNPFGNSALLKLRRWAGYVTEDRRSTGTLILQQNEHGKVAILRRLAQLHYDLLHKSNRWKSSGIDWGAESRTLLERVALISSPDEL